MLTPLSVANSTVEPDETPTSGFFMKGDRYDKTGPKRKNSLKEKNKKDRYASA